MNALRQPSKDMSQTDGEVWAKDKDLEIIELELPKSEKWW